MRSRRFSFSLISAQDGVTAVEFAFVSPVLLLLMMGIIEVSLILYAQSIMEGAAYDASRSGKTGYVAEGTTQEQTILDTLHRRAGELLTISNITIDSVAYNQFDQIGQPEPFVDANGNGVRDEGENYTDVNGNSQYDEDMGTSGAGNSSQVVVYTVSYPWPIFTPLVGQFLGGGNSLTLTARAVVQNEPY